MTFKNIFVLGAGAVGSVIGGLLSKNNDVTLIGNEEQVDAVDSRGLRISGDVDGTFDVQADYQIRELPHETLIFLTTKAYDSERAIRGIRRLLKEDTVIVVLQNGLGNEEIVKCAAGGVAKVLRGVTTMAAESFKVGEVKYWKGETIIERDAAAEGLADIMNASSLRTSLSENIEDVVWSKTVVNCVVNPLSAIFRVRNRGIGAQFLANVRHMVVRECVQVAAAEAITLPKDLEKTMEREILAYANYSSMCQDIMKGKKTEIDFLNGRIVELGRRHRVPTPMNEVLVSFIRFLEEKNELPKLN